MFTSDDWKRLQAAKPETANLGHLERELMEHVWKLGESSVSTVHDQLDGRLAYTTVMTTLDRLYKKGILDRRKQGRAFFYSAKLSRADFLRGMVRKALDFLIAEHEAETAPLMAHLVETFQQHDSRLLDELEQMIHRSRASQNAPKRSTEK